MYDLIGDIHGHADELVELLHVLGYAQERGFFAHQDRKAIFVGDFIDRGPQIHKTLKIARAMIDNDAALAVMGTRRSPRLCRQSPQGGMSTHGRRWNRSTALGRHTSI